jgi:ribosomal-protein-alanine N-acetyltransferase
MNADADGIIIRPPRPEDLAAVVALENRCFGDPWTPEALGQELVPDRLRLPLVAETAGKVVGYLMAWKIIDQLHILNLAADPDLRRRGVGTALLRVATAKAARMRMLEITLEVRESNAAARAFYQRHGFSVRGRRPGYYVDNGEDAIVMTRPVGRFPDS